MRGRIFVSDSKWEDAGEILVIGSCMMSPVHKIYYDGKIML